MPPSIRVVAEPEYDFVTKVGSIDLEYGVQGRELELELKEAQDTFIRAMELHGLTLVRKPGFDNPVWVTHPEGQMAAFYAIDWEGSRPQKTMTAGGEVVLPTTREMSLEDSRGMVEYRVAGIFWGPKTSLEVLRDKQLIKDEERAKQAPITFGPGGRTEFQVGEVGRDYEPDL